MNTGHSDYLTHEFRAMASPCAFHLPLSLPDVKQLALQMESEVRRIEAKFSRYRDDSVLSQINQSAGRTIPLDDETLWLLNYASACYTQSEGRFDITSGVLREVWDFRAGRLPDSQALGDVRARIGFQRLRIEGASLHLPEGMELDLGGLGKEYAADAAAAIAREAGVSSGAIDLGGDLHILGPHADGQPWLLGVRHPRQPDQAIATLPVYQGGMASSGDYERFFEIEGQRYCHLLNPATGYPVDFWASVSVLAPSCLLAGTLSSITMLKEASGEDWLKEQGVRALLVRPDLSLVSL